MQKNKESKLVSPCPKMCRVDVANRESVVPWPVIRDCLCQHFRTNLSSQLTGGAKCKDLKGAAEWPRLRRLPADLRGTQYILPPTLAFVRSDSILRPFVAISVAGRKDQIVRSYHLHSAQAAQAHQIQHRRNNALQLRQVH